MNNKIDYKNLSKGDKILLWAEVTEVYRRSPSNGSNDIQVRVEFDLHDPSKMEIELAHCEVVEHRAYKSVFTKLTKKIKKIMGLKPVEEEALNKAESRF